MNIIFHNNYYIGSCTNIISPKKIQPFILNYSNNETKPDSIITNKRTDLYARHKMCAPTLYIYYSILNEFQPNEKKKKIDQYAVGRWSSENAKHFLRIFFFFIFKLSTVSSFGMWFTLSLSIYASPLNIFFRPTIRFG